MSDFTVRSDSVDVEQIMEQIRARIREKRGADYTEAELQQIATTNLRKFLDPKGVRSDLVEHFRKGRTAEEWPNYEFGETTLYESHRGFIRFMRRLLRPVLKLFFNPDPIVSALHIQSQLNTEILRESLRYELVHNLVIELTRASIEVQNLKMRVESLSSRLDFDERRARSLEHVVRTRQTARPARPAPATGTPAAPAADTGATATADAGSPAADDRGPGEREGGDREGGERRRRRRRRRRRPGSTLAESGADGTPDTDDAEGAGRAEPAIAPAGPSEAAETQEPAEPGGAAEPRDDDRSDRGGGGDGTPGQ
jgi:hypothetical protein